MKHLTIDQIQALIDDPSDKDLWSTHIENCSICREEYKSYLHVHRSLLELEYERPSLRFAKNIFEMISKRQLVARMERKWITIIQSVIFISIFMIILIATYFLLGSAQQIDLFPGFTGNTGWIFTLFLSICILWILYGIDKYLSCKRLNSYWKSH